MSETAADAASKVEQQEHYLQRVSHVPMGIAPKNLEEGFRLAQLLAKSTLVPADFRDNPGNVMIAIQLGMEVGLPPMQALQSIAVINGRPSLFGDGLLAVVMASPVFEWIDEPPVQGNVATCTVKRRGWGTPVSRTFSVDDAKKAGLWGKSGPWTTYPVRMLQMRARAFALRDVFADVLRGLSSAEEQQDVIDVSATPPKPAIAEVRRLASVAAVATVDTMTGEITEPEPQAETTTPSSGAPTVRAAEDEGKPVTASAGQSLVDALDEKPADPPAPKPATETPHADFDPARIYHLAQVHQPKPDKTYHMLRTVEGLVAHAWSATVIKDAKAACASKLPVRFVAERVAFAAAPWRITKVDVVDERQPGEDDE